MTAEKNSDSRKESVQHSTKQTNVDSSSKNCYDGFKMFLVALSFTFICKSLAGIYMKTVVPQIERRFGMTSSQASFIDGSFEIGNMLIITLVSHFGAKSHIPRVIGTGCLIMGIGCLLSAVPHFFMEYYRYEDKLHDKTLTNSTAKYVLCTTDQHSTGNNTSPTLLESSCKNETGSLMWIYIVMGNMIRGIGETSLEPLGIAYIDDFAKEGHSPFYIGIVHSMSIIGSIAGTLLGALCTKIYVDIGYVDLSMITITPTDSRWAGAWWIGFIVTGILSILSGLPFFFIPKNPNRRRMRNKARESLDTLNINDSNLQKVNVRNPQQTKKSQALSGYFNSLKRLITNKLYAIYLIFSLFMFSGIIGNFSHLSKYLEQQYGNSMSGTNVIFGVVMLPITGISLFLGGYIIRKFKLDRIGIGKLFFITHMCSFISVVLIATLDCGNKSVAGLTVTYKGNNAKTMLQSTPFSFCYSDCNCDANIWDPVCGNDGLTYISPCLAGCKSSVGHGKNLVFHNCTCLEENFSQSTISSAYLGECLRTEDCSKKFIFHVILQSLDYCFLGMAVTPAILLGFRNVEDDQKSLATGLSVLVFRALGGLLSPIYFGSVVDSACLKWATNSCGERGSCRIYEPLLFRNRFYGLTLGLRGVSIILLIYFLMAMRKKHTKNPNTGISKNEGRFVNELNLNETLNDSEQVGSSPNADNETCI